MKQPLSAATGRRIARALAAPLASLPALLPASPAMAAGEVGGWLGGTLVVVAAVAAAVAGIALVHARIRLRRLQAGHDGLHESLAELRAAARATGSGFMVWKGTGQEDAPRLAIGLAALVSAAEGATVVTLEEFRGFLDAADGAALGVAVKRLRENGEGFDMEVACPGSDRRLTLTGVRARDPGYDVLRVRDNTAPAEERSQLLAERARLRAMIDALPVPVWARNRDLEVIDCNASYVTAVEADSVAEVRAGSLELAGSAVGEGGRGLATAARNGSRTVSAARHVVVAGQRRLLDLSETPLPGDGFAGWALDQTVIEEARKELARHVATHGEVLERLATALAIFGPDHRMAFFNRAFRQLWDLDEAWLHSNPRLDEFLETLRENRQLPETADFPAFKKSWLDLFTSLIEAREEYLYLPDNRTLRMVVATHPMGGLLFTFEDVTDRLALERSYNTLIEVQRETLDNLGEAVAVIGSDGRLKLANPVMERMWALPEGLVSGDPHISEVLEGARALLPEVADWEVLRAAMMARFARRLPRSGRLERRDGSVIRYGLIPLPDGGMLVQMFDVTDSTRVARALRERNEALEAADRLKSEFIANVSYELRTPLNTIMGFVEILRNRYFGELNPRQLEYLVGIYDSSEELLSLINDILDLAMVDAGRMTLEIERVDIRSLMEGLAEQVAGLVSSKKLTLRLDVPDDIGVLDMDARRTRHALLNLIGNAVEFTPEGGVITMSARRTPEEVSLTIADTGIGIPDGEQSRIFDLFVRGKSRLGRRAGAGLGLSLVKSFVDLHGGRIEIQSAPDAGTRVTCWFPVHRAGGRAALPADHFAAEANRIGKP